MKTSKQMLIFFVGFFVVGMWCIVTVQRRVAQRGKISNDEYMRISNEVFNSPGVNLALLILGVYATAQLLGIGGRPQAKSERFFWGLMVLIFLWELVRYFL